MNAARSLMAVVFTDAVGYSTRAEQNEELALSMLTHDFEVMRTSCEAHGGRVMKSTGDGLLMAFDSAALGVDCALDIQRQFAHRSDEGFQHRMGIHLCDVVMEGSDIRGDGVNLAARLEAEASPGSICLSQTIYDIVKSRLPVQAKFLGERHLKNLLEPVNLFEIAPDNAPRGERIPPRARKSLTQYAMPAAVAFMGLCVVGAAVMILNQPRPTLPTPTNKTYIVREAAPNRSQTTALTMPKSEAAQKSTSSIKSAPLAAKAIPVENTAKTSAKAADPAALDPIERAKIAMVEYRDQRQVHKVTFDFDGMVSWLENEDALKTSPGYSRLLTHWRTLSEMRHKMLVDLASYTATNPLLLAAKGRRTGLRFWSGGPNKVTMQLGIRNPITRALGDLEPKMFRNLAARLLEADATVSNASAFLAEFDTEYPTRIPAKLAGDNPFISG